MKKFTKFSRGFTLIELLVVIAIIGVLSSIVLAALSTARSKANDSKVQEQLSGFRSAAEIYNSANAGYVANSAAGDMIGATVQACTAGAGASGSVSFANSVFNDATSGANNIMLGVGSTTGVVSAGMSCVASTTAWAVQVNLPSGGSNGNGYWCVDSTGKSKAETGSVAVSATQLCP